jgi:hypothetical protein
MNRVSRVKGKILHEVLMHALSPREVTNVFSLDVQVASCFPSFSKIRMQDSGGSVWHEDAPQIIIIDETIIFNLLQEVIN